MSAAAIRRYAALYRFQRSSSTIGSVTFECCVMYNGFPFNTSTTTLR